MKKGVRNPKAEKLIKFDISGPGKVVAVANSNSMRSESFQGTERKAWRGKCLVIIKSERAEGVVRLKAVAEGLTSSEVITRSGNRQNQFPVAGFRFVRCQSLMFQVPSLKF